MRWESKPEPEHGQIRKIQRFALLPRLVGDTWVWLEKYVEVQTYWETNRMGRETDMGISMYPRWKWKKDELL